MDKPLSFVYGILRMVIAFAFDLLFPQSRTVISYHRKQKNLWASISGQKNLHRHIQSSFGYILSNIKSMKITIQYCGQYHFKPLKHLVWSAKYENDTDATKLCAEILSDEIIARLTKSISPTVDNFLITTVPSTTYFRGEKDFDHMREILKIAQYYLKSFVSPLHPNEETLLYISNKYLEKNIKENKSLNKKDRFKESKNKFEASPEVCKRSIVLLDDIITTGASMEDCIRALNESGAAHIYCISLAH